MEPKIIKCIVTLLFLIRLNVYMQAKIIHKEAGVYIFKQNEYTHLYYFP